MADEHVAAWVRLVRARDRVMQRIEADLKKAGLPPLAWYDVLLELSRTDGGLRPYRLQAEMLMPQYNMSRLLDRMEKSGYVVRRTTAEDRRGQIVEATGAGHALRKKMWPVYRAALEREVANRLSQREAAMLGELLGKLTDDP